MYVLKKRGKRKMAVVHDKKKIDHRFKVESLKFSRKQSTFMGVFE